MAEQAIYKSKTDIVEEYLRRKITRGEIRPGQRLQQDAVALELGTSSTPVREALRRLEAEGLVTYLPHKGVMVREVDSSRIHEIYVLRALLEGFSTREAVPRLTEENLVVLVALHEDMRAYLLAGDMQNFTATNDQWHMTIHKAAASELLRQMIAWLWRISPWDALWVIPGRAEAAHSEHQRILEALRRRDAATAEQTMADHIRSGERALVRFSESHKRT